MPTSPASDDRPEEADARPDTAEDTAPDDAAAVATLQEELAQTHDRLRRAMADLDNYRKRVERDADRRADEVRHALLREWLVVIDSVERALRMEPDDPGLTAVLEQMESILARHGVVRLDAVGTRFDPAQHEAVAVKTTTEVPDYTVLEVTQSGFGRADGEVLRPAQVVVARQPTGGA